MEEITYTNNYIKKCPFCGGIPIIHKLKYDESPLNLTAYWVCCQNCSAEIKNPSETEYLAISKWNTRENIRELTKEEWEIWKKDKRRDPICMVWYEDTTPFWVLKPEQIHEPAYFMGKIKLFNGKPSKDQIKWN